MHCVAISDIHGFLEKPSKMPNGDVLCICGDIVPLEYQSSYERSIAWFLLEFVPWTDKLPYKKVIVVAGNHDFFFERLHKKGYSLEYDKEKDCTVEHYTWRSPSDVLKCLLPGNNKAKHKLTYLCDNSIEIEGIVFYGSPWVNLRGWAFHQNSEGIRDKFSKIPKRCDVILTHTPPKFAGLGQVHSYLNDYGSQELADMLAERQFKYALCGHVHSGQHSVVCQQDKHYANVSIKDEDYSPTYFPLEFDVE